MKEARRFEVLADKCLSLINALEGTSRFVYGESDAIIVSGEIERITGDLRDYIMEEINRRQGEKL